VGRGFALSCIWATGDVNGALLEASQCCSAVRPMPTGSRPPCQAIARPFLLEEPGARQTRRRKVSSWASRSRCPDALTGRKRLFRDASRPPALPPARPGLDSCHRAPPSTTIRFCSHNLPTPKPATLQRILHALARSLLPVLPEVSGCSSGSLIKPAGDADGCAERLVPSVASLLPFPPHMSALKAMRGSSWQLEN